MEWIFSLSNPSESKELERLRYDFNTKILPSVTPNNIQARFRLHPIRYKDSYKLEKYHMRKLTKTQILMHLERFQNYNLHETSYADPSYRL